MDEWKKRWRVVWVRDSEERRSGWLKPDFANHYLRRLRDQRLKSCQENRDEIEPGWRDRTDSG